MEAVLVLFAAVAFVALVDLRTAETAPLWDGKWYYELAQEGLAARRVSPFVFRPGMPFLSRWLAATGWLELEPSYKLVGRIAATLVLCFSYAGARTLGATLRSSAFVALVVGLGYHHVRFPLYFWSLVDVAGYAFLLLAFVALWRGWIVRAGLIAVLGLFFKEMLLIPWVVSLVEGALRARRRTAARAWLGPAAVALFGLAVFVLPRLFLRIDHSQQWIDPLHAPETLGRLWEAPRSPERWFTVAAAVLTYWLPTLLLVTRARLRAIMPVLREHRRSLGIYGGLLLVLVLYGGTNIAVFVSYSVAAQVLFLATLLRVCRVERWELLYTLGCLFFFQHFHRAIPDPHVQRESYLVFYGLGDPATNTRRLAQASAWLAVMLGSRFLARRARPRAIR